MVKIMHSIKPELCEKIISGDCSIILTKTKPKKIKIPFECCIYCMEGQLLFDLKNETYLNTSHRYALGENKSNKINQMIPPFINRKVIGEFVCDKIYDILAYEEFYGTHYGWNFDFSLSDTCLTEKEFEQYFSQNINGYIKPINGYGWHISDFKIYDEPKNLKEFFRPCPFQDDYIYGRECLNCKFLDKNIYGGICSNVVTQSPHPWCYAEEGE